MKRLSDIALWSPVIVSLVVLLVAVGIRLQEPVTIKTVRNLAFDQYQRWNPRPISEPPVQIVDIDEESIAKLGQWPWPRHLMGKLVDRLVAEKSAAIAFDMLFSEADRTSPGQFAIQENLGPELAAKIKSLPDHDRVFADALARAPSVMGLALTSLKSDAAKPVVKHGFAAVGNDPKPFLLSFPGAITSLALFDQAAKGIGAMNFSPDRDGVVRLVPLLSLKGGMVVASLAAEALRVAQGASTYIVTSAGASSETSLGQDSGIVSVKIGDLVVPTDKHGRVWMYFGSAPKSRTISAWKLISDDAPKTLPKDFFANKVALIGASATGLLDLRFSPLGAMAGVEIQAQLIGQMLSGQLLSRPDWASGAELLFFILFGAVVIFFSYKFNPVISAMVSSGTVVLAAAVSYFAFSLSGVLLDPLYPSAVVILTFLVCSILRYRQIENERRWITEAFSSYVSPNIVDQLVRHPQQMKLGGERRVLSFIFTDLAGFTPLVEGSEPGALIPLLNEYLNNMIEIGFAHGATLDAIIGDALLFYFNAPLDQPDHADSAIACALALDKFASAFSKAKQADGIALGKTRIGVHTGPVIIGNMGGDVLFNYAAHGDAINTASRMEGVNKHLGTNICVSIETASQAINFRGRPVGTIVLKGKSAGIVAFEPLSEEDMKSPRVEEYLAAYDKMAAEDPSAINSFKDLAQKYPDDSLIKFHGERLSQGQIGLTITMTEK